MDRLLLKELDNQGAKYSEDEIVFITRDKDGQIVWLERGNSFAGLKHIVKNHGEDFRRACDISEEQLPSFSERVVSEGEVISSRPTKNALGKDKVYDFQGNYYMFAGIGNNGFIVTAFPVRKGAAQ